MAPFGSSPTLPTWVNCVSAALSPLHPICALTLPSSLIGSHFPHYVTPPALSACSLSSSSFFSSFKVLCLRVCVCVSWMLGGSFRLIKDMIYRSMMLAEFPDHFSNLLRWALSPLNLSQPLKSSQQDVYMCDLLYMHHAPWRRAWFNACFSLPISKYMHIVEHLADSLISTCLYNVCHTSELFAF